jgi:hypothetical protein
MRCSYLTTIKEGNHFPSPMQHVPRQHLLQCIEYTVDFWAPVQIESKERREQEKRTIIVNVKYKLLDALKMSTSYNKNKNISTSFLVPDAFLNQKRSLMDHRHGGAHTIRGKQKPKRRYPLDVVSEDGTYVVLESTPESYKIPYAPIFYPTREEFEDPISYIDKIRPIAEVYGICKIVPPDDYNLIKHFYDKNDEEEDTIDTSKGVQLEDLGVNENTFCFKTKVQKINNLMYRAGNLKPNSPEIKKRKLAANGTSNGNAAHAANVSNKRRKMNIAYKSQLSSEQQLDHLGIENEDDEEEDDMNFGFDRSAEKISLRAFRKKADEFKKEFFSRQIEKSKQRDAQYLAPCNEETTIRNRILPRPLLRKLARRGGIQRVSNVIYYDNEGNLSEGDIESEYWRIVECIDPNMPDVVVQYGSDLISMPVHDNSCFPRHWDCNWALTKLPIVDNSMLKYLYMNVPGITSPMLYVGMLFSSFCWHVEDHFLYAINYLHYGAKKTWYGVPGTAAEKFEKFMRSQFPGLFSANPKLLECLVTTFNPRLLVENDIPVYRMIHEPGTYIVTFPRAYHSGFNHGFNFAESTNFAPGEWLPWGRICADRYYLKQRPSAFSHDQIVLTAMKHLDAFPAQVQDMLKAQVTNTILLEQQLRARVRLKKDIVKMHEMPNTKKNPHLTRRAAVRDNKVCALCKQDCYLSAVICHSCFESSRRNSNVLEANSISESELYLCLKCALKDFSNERLHSADLCDHKHKEKLCLLFRFTDEQLSALLQEVIQQKKTF